MAKKTYGWREFYKGLYNWITDEMWDSWERSGFLSQKRYIHGAYESTGDEMFVQWLAFYDQYMKDIAKYKGTDFYELLANNPDLQFQVGLDQASLNSRINSVNEYKSNILGTKQQNRYNSTVAAAARDSAAGFNDALTGSLAGQGSAAENTPSEETPLPGLSPEGQIQDTQNRFDRFISGVTTVSSLASSFLSGLQAFTQIRDLVKGLSVKDANIANLEEQTHGEEIENRAKLRQDFVKNIVGSIPWKEGQKLNSDSFKSFPRGAYSEKDLKYFDELQNSGYFFDESGAPSLALKRAYSGDFSGVMNDVSSAAQAGSQIADSEGNVPVDEWKAIENHFTEFGKFQHTIIQSTAAIQKRESEIKDLQAIVQVLQVVQESQKVDILDSQSREAAASAANAQTLADYNAQVYSKENAEARKAAQKALDEAQKKQAENQQTMETLKAQYLDLSKKNVENNSPIGAFFINKALAMQYDGLFKAYNNAQEQGRELDQIVTALKLLAK